MTMLNDCSARFLMCRPEHFAVSYTINPWMDPKRWARDAGAHAAAEREWAALHRKLVELGATVELVPPAPGLPDLVFTANAAVVLDRQALLARFRHPQRQREEGAFRSSLSVAAGARPDRWREKAARGPRARRRRRLRLGRAAQSVLDGLRPALRCGGRARGRRHVRTRGDGARTCGPPFLPRGHGARAPARRRSHVSARAPSPRPERAAIRERVATQRASRSPSRTAAASRPTPSVSARL